MTLKWLGQLDLPPCYSAEFDVCINDYRTKKPAELSAFCSKYYDLWKNTPEAAWNAAMDKMPICATEAPKAKTPSPMLFLGVGLLGVLVGTLLS
jgi:hypothetical protein